MSTITASETRLDFGDVLTGTTKSLPLGLVLGNLTVDPQVSFDPPECFTLSPSKISGVKGQAFVELYTTVTFKPGEAKAYSAKLLVKETSGTTTTSVEVALSGTGKGAVAWSESSLAFGEVGCGGSSEMAISATVMSLVADATVTVTGPFTASVATIAKSNSRTMTIVRVTFTPTATGDATGTLTLAAGGETAMASLSGTGTQVVTFAPEPLQFDELAPGATATMDVTISIVPAPASALNLSLGGHFSAVPTAYPANATSSTHTVTFQAPASKGYYNGELSLTLDSADHAVELLAQVGVNDGFQQDPTDNSYLLFKVPDFGDTTFVNATALDAVDGGIDPSGVSGNSIQTYLRLGSFKFADETPAAKELLRMIPKAGSATDPNLPDPGAVIIPGEEGGLIFNDDTRKRAQDKGLTVADDPDHKLTKAERHQESERLYARGGLRDHTDGNRITTTWGDKVEVVRGNYKMIVLGRQNDPAQAMGWEASGAHIQDYAPGTMPGASLLLEWIPDPRYHAPADPVGDGRKGVWLLCNTTENVYEYARKAGNFREEIWGDVHEAYRGSENPPKDGAFGTDDTGGSGGHEPPHRLEGRSYDFPGTSSNDGRSKPPWTSDNKGMIRSNPHLIEKTWAERIDSWTGSAACPVPSINEKTYAKKVDSFTKIEEKSYSEETVYGSKIDVSTVFGFSGSFSQVVGLFLETTNAIIHISQEASLALDIYLGVKIEIVAGASLEIDALKLELELTKTGLHIKKDELAIAKTELEGKITTLAGETTAIKGKCTDLSGKITQLTNSDTKLANTVTTLGNRVHMIAAQVNFL